jgi:hypothetical protein
MIRIVANLVGFMWVTVIRSSLVVLSVVVLTSYTSTNWDLWILATTCAIASRHVWLDKFIGARSRKALRSVGRSDFPPVGVGKTIFPSRRIVLVLGVSISIILSKKVSVCQSHALTTPMIHDIDINVNTFEHTALYQFTGYQNYL